MAEHKPTNAAPWRSADPGADRILLGSWAVLLALALWLLPQQAPETGAPAAAVPVEAEQIIPRLPVAVNEPDFYPWIRPVAAPPGAPSLPRWAPPQKPRTGGFLTRLASPARDPVFFASTYSNTESFYGGDWRAENVASRAGGAFLEVRRESHGGLPFTAGEMQSHDTFQYGRYEVIMQPARGSGLVTAFFTYTGPWFGNPHDEIDIEFLGADTTKIHFNYFRNGKSIKPATFDLPFDASARPHLYAFEWRPDGVTWFVDGVPYYATEAGDTAIPKTAGKVMFSAWTGKPVMEGWHGEPVFRDGAGAQFNCVSFTPMGHDTPGCADSYDPASATGLAAGRRR